MLQNKHSHLMVHCNKVRGTEEFAATVVGVVAGRHQQQSSVFIADLIGIIFSGSVCGWLASSSSTFSARTCCSITKISPSLK